MCDGEYNFFDGMKEQYQVPCVKILLNWFIRKSVFHWNIADLTCLGIGILLGGWYLFEILHTLSTVKTSENCFYKILRWKAQTFYEMKEVCKVLCVKPFLADLWGNKHLFEILQTLLTSKNSEKVIKSGCFKKLLRSNSLIRRDIKEGYKDSCLKLLIFC